MKPVTVENVTVTVLKMKFGKTPTVIEINGHRYVLEEPRQIMPKKGDQACA